MNDMNAILAHVRLKFNIEHPTYEECYADGYAAAAANLDIDQNPFAETTSEAGQWQEGWWDGFYGEEPLFDSAPIPIMEQTTHAAVNDQSYLEETGFFGKVLKITGAIAVSAVVGYQLIDLVA